MTRKKEEATAGLRRGRTLATAGLGAATLIGGLVYAAPAANAATAPTVTVTAPVQLNNDGTTGPLTVEVKNNAADAVAYANAAIEFKVTIPAGLTCADVAVASDAGATQPGPAILKKSADSATGTCDFQSTEITAPAAGVATASDVTYGYTIGVNGTQTHPGAPDTHVTGTVSTVGQLDATNGSGTYVSTIATSTAATSTLLTAGAAVFNTGAVPLPVIYQPYNYTLVKDPGYPTTVADFSAVQATKAANGTYTYGAPVTVATDTSTKDAAGNELWNLVLGTSGFAFQMAVNSANQVVSGKIINTGSLNAVNNDLSVTWTIIANNGQGGAPAGGTPANGATPALAAGDVASPAFTPAVVFADVDESSPFVNDIYTLANDGVINGQINGDFNVAGAVTRGAFAAFAVRELDASTYTGTLHEGPCDASSFPSSFSDVPNNSQFCGEINTLAGLGVTTGYKDGTFGPGVALSRQVVAAFFYRLSAAVNNATVTDAAPVNTKFADVQKDNIFSGDINWAVNSTPTQIINGYSDGTFRPTGVATRQVTAAYLARFGQDYLGLWAGVTGL